VTDVQRLLDVLRAAGVDFVVVGGVALVLRGSSRVTLDLAEIAEIRRRLRT